MSVKVCVFRLSLTMFAKGCGLCPCSVYICVLLFVCVLIKGKGSHRPHPVAAECPLQRFIKQSVC